MKHSAQHSCTPGAMSFTAGLQKFKAGFEDFMFFGPAEHKP